MFLSTCTWHPQATGTAATPKLAASLRSAYIKQIRELHELLDVEAISEEDFTKHKAKINPGLDACMPFYMQSPHFIDL